MNLELKTSLCLPHNDGRQVVHTKGDVILLSELTPQLQSRLIDGDPILAPLIVVSHGRHP